MFSGILNVNDVNSLYYSRMIACSQTLLLCRGWWPLWHIMRHSGNTPEGFGRHARSSESMEWRQQREAQKAHERTFSLSPVLAFARALMSQSVNIWDLERGFSSLLGQWSFLWPPGLCAVLHGLFCFLDTVFACCFSGPPGAWLLPGTGREGAAGTSRPREMTHRLFPAQPQLEHEVDKLEF